MRVYSIDQPEAMGDIFYKEDKYERIMHDPELKSAFLCGMKFGKESAEEDYHERNRGGYYGGGYNHRDMDWEEMRRLEEEYHERRRRRANGRFY